MIDGIEALIALDRTGTISEAAAQLRITQSAVSKRLQSLQDELHYKLIEPDGRRVRLTSEGRQFLERAKPLLAEFKSLKDLNLTKGQMRYSIGLADSIAATWGPKLIKQALRKIKNLEFDLHVHRSTLVEENVKLGRYDLGICVPQQRHFSPQNLISTKIIDEPLVFIFNRFDADNMNETNKVITIEKNSGTWKTLEDKLQKNIKIKNAEFIFVESFLAITQMVKEGFGHGIIPLGVALNQNVPKKSYTLFSPNIDRDIYLIGRKNIFLQEPIQEFTETLKELARDLF
ncbi:MAG: LysR family transcriptional regulator [Pseudobdellovibrio sp.]